ncbi:endonuclease domain-containing protein [Mycobacterium sp. WMMD1722]|uniref:endonuclease domain-containing protein n=1 Tax=Mycobacterium sp. WMMD1722 TaxID=3404117 RepID=UPI003BF4C777
MQRPFLGSEALAAGVVNRYQLSTRYDTVFRNVYVPRGQILTCVDRAVAAWLWSGRRATVAGVSAAALLGTRWIDAKLPAELNQPSRHRTTGILLHSDVLAEDERCEIGGVPITTPARTAFDLGRRKGLTTAVVRLDALRQATRLDPDAVEALASRHHGVRGLVQLRRVLALSEAGAESPQETRTRLVLTAAGLRPTHTQIEVFDRDGFVARIDMGYPRWKVGVEYDGAQHWTDPAVRDRDLERRARLTALGWRIVHVNAELLHRRPAVLVARTEAALREAGRT